MDQEIFEFKGRLKFLVTLGIFVLGVLLYANTFEHSYTLDDKIAITDNTITQKGFDGIGELLTTGYFEGFFNRETKLVSGGRYRPLSLVTFAMEYDVWGEAPGPSHMINALLYGLTGIMLFWVFLRITPITDSKKWYFSVPVIATLLFVTHPIHTEVVASIKGRDEMLSLVFALGTLLATFRYIDSGKIIWPLIAWFSFFLAMMAKESAITFVVLVPLTVYWFTQGRTKRNLIAFASILLSMGAYLALRFSVVDLPSTGGQIQELMNNPFANATESERLATIAYTLGLYLKLLVFPNPLTHDYYPMQIPIINWGDIRALAPLVAYLGMIAYAALNFKRGNIVTYSIMFYLITLALVSNIVFPIGSPMNERFIYFSSIGFCLVLAYFLEKGLRQIKDDEQYIGAISLIMLGAFLLGFSYKTIDRNKAWKSDYILSTTDVKVSANSAKAHMAAGSSILTAAQNEMVPDTKMQYLMDAVTHLQRSLEIYPGYIQAMMLMGNTSWEQNYPKIALQQYENVLKRNPKYRDALVNTEYVASQSHSGREARWAIKGYQTLLKYNHPDPVKIYGKLGEIFSRYKLDHDSALFYILKAYELAPLNTDVLQKLGVVKAMTGDHAGALEIFLQSLDLQPGNAYIMKNVGIAYNKLGESDKAKAYLDEAYRLVPELQTKSEVILPMAPKRQ